MKYPERTSKGDNVFVGEDRERVVQRLLETWSKTTAAGSPQFATLVGEPGFGKTRLVHELYRCIAAEQRDPAYWPKSIDHHMAAADDDTTAVALTASLRNTRKLVRPEEFEVNPDSTPQFLWLGTVLADAHGVHTDSGLDDIIAQLSMHLAPLLRKQEFRKRVIKLARSVAGLIPMAEALEVAIDMHSLVSDISELFQRTPSGTRIAKNSGYEERLAAFYRTVRSIWGENGDKGPPVVLVIEDFHAAREPTIALINQVLAAGNLPFFLIACSQRQALTNNEPAQRLVDSPNPAVTKIDIDKLGRDDIVLLAKQMLPRTPDFLIELLADRADGNAYSLKLQLLSLRRMITEGVLAATADDLADLPIEVDEILLRLWHQLPNEHQQILGILSLAGHTAPESLDLLMLSEIDHLKDYSAADTGWVRNRLDHRVFLELVRWELAKRHSLPTLSNGERRQAISAALKAIVAAIERQNEVHSLDNNAVLRSCLGNLLPEALQLHIDFDRLAVADELTNWAHSLLWSRMYSESLRLTAMCRQILSHASVRKTRRGQELMCRILRLTCVSTRLMSGHGSGHPAAISTAQDFLDWAEGVKNAYPPAIVQANLAMSRACRVPDGDAGELLEQAQRSLAAANELYVELNITDLSTERDLLAASYPWLSRAGRRADAAAAAREVTELSRQLFGEDDPRVDEAMHDAAFYTRRVDPNAGVLAYRNLLERRLRRWGDASHPVVASQMKDLGAALLHLGDEDSVREATSLLETAYASHLRSSGPKGRDTAMTQSLLSLALVRLVPFLPDREAAPIRKRALDLAEEALGLRKAVRPRSHHLAQRANLAHAQLANGDVSGFQELENILAHRVGRFEDPLRVAEIRWQVRRMSEAYSRFDRHERAQELIAEFRLDEPDSKWLA